MKKVGQWLRCIGSVAYEAVAANSEFRENMVRWHLVVEKSILIDLIAPSTSPDR